MQSEHSAECSRKRERQKRSLWWLLLMTLEVAAGEFGAGLPLKMNCVYVGFVGPSAPRKVVRNGSC